MAVIDDSPTIRPEDARLIKLLALQSFIEVAAGLDPLKDARQANYAHREAQRLFDELFAARPPVH